MEPATKLFWNETGRKFGTQLALKAHVAPNEGYLDYFRDEASDRSGSLFTMCNDEFNFLVSWSSSSASNVGFCETVRSESASVSRSCLIRRFSAGLSSRYLRFSFIS